MAGNKPEQEPSIEEILASIRQIISDDEEPRAAGDIEMPAEEKFDIPVYQSEPAKEEPVASSFADVLELTNEVGGEEEKSFDLSEEKFDIPVSAPIVQAEPAPRSAEIDLSFNAEPAPKPVSAQDDIDSLFTTPAAEATTEAFTRLLGNIPVEREENKRLYADGRITLEDIAKDLMRPMLRQWIDDHVPAMVERLVEKELEKLARQARE